MTGEAEQERSRRKDSRSEVRDLGTLAEALDAAGSALLGCDASVHFSEPFLFAAAKALSARDAVTSMLQGSQRAVDPAPTAPACYPWPPAEPAELARRVITIAAAGREYLATPARQADPVTAATVRAHLAEITSLLEQSAAR
jgi:hypothetical protein